MQSVLNVLQNRSKARNSSIYAEATRRTNKTGQFSSMTSAGDPNLVLYAAEDDTQWLTALVLAGHMADGILPDITGGAINYYATSMEKPPYWAAEMEKTVEIAGQIFFRKIE